MLRGPGNGAIQPILPGSPALFLHKTLPGTNNMTLPIITVSVRAVSQIRLRHRHRTWGPRIGGEGAGALERDLITDNLGQVDFGRAEIGVGEDGKMKLVLCSDDQSAFISRE
ncbi:hypothetical protein MMC29_002139, partial [Sticta canariensis]|nr:hypothetical protein [Sticta canariensis]